MCILIVRNTSQLSGKKNIHLMLVLWAGIFNIFKFASTKSSLCITCASNKIR